MTTSIIFFIFALAVAFAMIARKIWLLRSGRLAEGSYEEADWTDISIEGVRMRLVEIFKFSVHHIALFALKTWIQTSNFVRRVDASMRTRLVKILHHNGHAGADSSPSPFLQDMTAHKETVSQAIQKESSDSDETDLESEVEK